MQKNLKNDLDTKYNDIFRNLYVQWKLQSKKKYEELQLNGLDNSGAGSRTMYILLEELINKTICDLQQLFNNLPAKYNRKISLKELNKYKGKTLNNIYGHIESMKKELQNDYENKLSFTYETTEIFLNNLKSNSKDKIERYLMKLLI